MTAQQLLQLERAMLAGVLCEQAWNEALGQVAELVRASYLAVMTRDRETGLIHVVEPVMVAPQVIEDYENNFKHLNPMNSMRVLENDGDQYLDWAELGHEFIRRSPYYQEFMHAHGLGYLMAYRVDACGGGPVNYLSIHRQANEAAFAAEDAANLSAVHGALSRTFALRGRLHGLQRAQAWQRTALDTLSFPILLVDGHGRVEQANRAAETWLSRPGSPLAARHAGANRQTLLHIVRQALGAGGSTCLASARLPNAPDQGTLCVAMPLEHDGAFMARAGSALLMLWPAHPREPARVLLQQVFGLSPAEAQVAELLAQGHTPQDIATLKSRGETTVRSHIKAIFRKMHVHRQHDLARLLSEIGLVDAHPRARG